jgi:hypothetical protein
LPLVHGDLLLRLYDLKGLLLGWLKLRLLVDRWPPSPEGVAATFAVSIEKDLV